MTVIGWRPSSREVGQRVSLARVTGLREFLCSVSVWRKESLTEELGREVMRRATPDTLVGWDPEQSPFPERIGHMARTESEAEGLLEGCSVGLGPLEGWKDWALGLSFRRWFLPSLVPCSQISV